MITYDRRGNSRSPRPSGWTSTTVDEQADDAAALLRGLDLAPAIVFGGRASIAANLAIRHPAVLRGGYSMSRSSVGGRSAANSRERRKALSTKAWPGGIRAATELFLLSVAGQATYESLIPSCVNACYQRHVLVNIELTPLPEYEPTSPNCVDAPTTPRHRRRQPRHDGAWPLEIRSSHISLLSWTCRTAGRTQATQPAHCVRPGTSPTCEQADLAAVDAPVPGGTAPAQSSDRSAHGGPPATPGPEAEGASRAGAAPQAPP